VKNGPSGVFAFCSYAHDIGLGSVS
jgi:hypothetical protein